MRYLFAVSLAALSSAAPAAAENAVPPLPTAVSSFGAAECGGYIYVFAGHKGTAHSFTTEDVIGSFLRFKLDGGTEWEELPGGEPMQGTALVALGGKLYRVGGMRPEGKPGQPTVIRSLASCRCFDPAANSWSDLPDLPAGRSSHDAVAVDGKIYVVGGWDLRGNSADATWHKTALVFDPAEPAAGWREIPQPFTRRAMTAQAHDGKVYVLGGMTEEGLDRGVEVYDPAAGSWSEGPDLPGLRMNAFSLASAVLDGKLYIAPYDGSLYRLAEAGWKPTGKLERPRFVHRMVAVPGRVIVLGGASPKGNVAEAEVIDPAAGG